MGRSAWLNNRNVTTTGFPKLVCQEDRGWQIVVSRGPGIVERVSTSWKALWTSMSKGSECNQGRCSRTLRYFLDPLSQLHNYNNRNGFLPRLPKPRTEWGRRTTYFRDFNNWSSLPIELNRPMPDMIFKRNLNRFLGNSS